MTIFANRDNMKPMFLSITRMMIFLRRLAATVTKQRIRAGQTSCPDFITHFFCGLYLSSILFPVSGRMPTIPSLSFFSLSEASCGCLALWRGLISGFCCFTANFTPMGKAIRSCSVLVKLRQWLYLLAVRATFGRIAFSHARLLYRRLRLEPSTGQIPLMACFTLSTNRPMSI